jgi:thiosulfate dehydrogenase
MKREHPKAPARGGLALFAARSIGSLLTLVVAGNLLFDRSLHEPLSSTSLKSAATRLIPLGTAAAQPASAAPAAPAKAAPDAFRPPAEQAMPDGEYGKVIRLGEQVFLHTNELARQYVGNDLSCANCHLDAGRQPNSAPLWAAFIHYPAFRAKTGKVDTLASRIQGCFQYSMNGKAPAANDPLMTALQTYAYWLATGAPVGKPVAGSGYPKLAKAAQSPDYARGQKVYAANCALCHGADGLGQRAGGRQVFPPLWGPRSFNWGAGMHQLSNASAFVKANMPLGKGGTLSDQDAWDVAYFMDAHERPQDPRYKGSIAQTRKAFHDTEDSLYGTTVNGRLLGAGTGAN